MGCHFFRILGFTTVLLASSGCLADESDVIYAARAGDTLIGLEKQLLAIPFDWKGLRFYNHILSPMRIPVGTPIRIPERWLRVEPRVARVLALSGGVTLNGRPLALDMPVPAGAVLRTEAGSFVTLVMPDESRLTVQPASEARLEKVQGFHGLKGQNTEIRLEQGRVETSVAAQRGPAARYQIRTPTAVIGVRGTEFRVGSDLAAGISQAEVTGGEISLSSSASTEVAALPAGYGMVARPGERLPAPRPLLVAPQIGDLPAVFERVELHFSFSPVAEAHAYRAQIARDPQFRDVVMTGIFPEPAVRFGDLPDGAYWLRVRAIDAVGLEGLDATHAFTLQARPEPPRAQPVAPESGGALAWSAASEASRYRLQVARDASFAAPVLERETKDLEARLGLPMGQYLWRIASLRADGRRGPWSEAHSLSLRTIPGPVSLTVYNDKARFAWPAEPGRIYEFELARDAGFTDVLLRQRIGEAAITLPLPAMGSYHLRLRGLDLDGGTSPWSASQSLHPLFFLPFWSLSSPALTSP